MSTEGLGGGEIGELTDGVAGSEGGGLVPKSRALRMAGCIASQGDAAVPMPPVARSIGPKASARPIIVLLFVVVVVVVVVAVVVVSCKGVHTR
jgi:hypothetical protein